MHQHTTTTTLADIFFKDDDIAGRPNIALIKKLSN
jgi:hypothetical protein